VHHQCNGVEEWLPVTDWEGIYEISCLGNLRRIARRSDARKPGPAPNRILSPKINKHGYPRANLVWQNKAHWYSVHTLVAQAFLGPEEPHMTVNHKNGIKADNRALNLEWADRRRQGEHAVQLGLQGRAKLNLEAVTAILTQPEVPNQIWMEQFHVSRAAIQNVRRRRTWAHAKSDDWHPCSTECDCRCHYGLVVPP
jgi:hypothetical protein